MTAGGTILIKRGRPPGSDDSPERLIRAELIAHLKLYRKIRELVEKRIGRDESLDAEEISKYMDLLRRGIGDMAKAIAPTKDATRVPESEISSEELLDQLLVGDTQ